MLRHAQWQTTPSTSRRSRPEGTSNAISSAKSRDEIQWLPNQNPSRSWLCLESLSIKMMNRDDTENRPDLLPEIRTKLRLQSYEDGAAIGRGYWNPTFTERLPLELLNALSKSTQVDWLGNHPRTLNHPVKGREVVQDGQDETCIVPPKSKVQLLEKFSGNLNSPRSVIPVSCNTPSGPPFLKGSASPEALVLTATWRCRGVSAKTAQRLEVLREDLCSSCT